MSMPRMNGQSVPQRNRNISGLSEARRRDSLLRGAYVNIVSGFHCRPEPRGAWDEPARGRTTPWNALVTPIRSAIRDAVNSGNPVLINQTLENARAFCRELEADFASLVPSNDEASILALALDETKHQGPADEATLALVSSPCPTAAERAVPLLESHHTRMGKLLDWCRVHARAPRTASMVGIVR